MTDALAYAHGVGIVHRDIKPENILLTGGHALLADFGIAKALDEAGGERLTATGLAVGTPAYMSPEQAAGAARLDGRSDPYSLGCVLYELLAGQPPFVAPTPQAVLARHSIDPVPPLRTVRRSVPAAVERAVLKVLEKVPADRFTTAQAFALALADAETTRVAAARRRGPAAALALGLTIVIGIWGVRILREPAGAAPPADGVCALAVLPVSNLTGDTAQVYLADVMTDQFISELAQVGALKVIGRRSVLEAAETGTSAREIARELRADVLLAGAVVAPLRGDPRFREIVCRVGLPP